MSQFMTDQEQFWAGGFGDEYAARNASAQLLAGNLAFFSKIVGRTGPLDSVVELGANIGMNLRALSQLLPAARLAAVEINEKACETLRGMSGVEVVQGSLLDSRTSKPAAFSFVKGVLIHINPDRLADAYRTLAESSTKWVMIAEYYNPSPMTVTYRGHSERLFKRDFAGEFMVAYPEFRLVDYGFLYRRDPVFPQDDITWFLMEKSR